MMFRTLRRRIALAICPDLGPGNGLPADPGLLPMQQWVGQAAWLPRGAAAPEPFIAAEGMRAHSAALRHGRIECAKQILQVVQSVQLHGLPGRDDPAFDVLSEEFAVLLFGKK